MIRYVSFHFSGRFPRLTMPPTSTVQTRAKSARDDADTKAGEARSDRATQKREVILKAACELLEERGIGAMTMEEVAARAGVAKTTLYRRWSTKGSLAIEGFLKEMSTRLRFDNSPSAVADIKTQLRRVAETFKSPKGRVIFGLIAEAQRDPETMTAFLNGYVLPRRELTSTLFQRGIDGGELRPDFDIDLAIDMIYAPMYYRILMGLEPYDAAKMERSVDMVIAGLNGDFKPAGRKPRAASAKKSTGAGS
jgi:AcrR family transcriptional regulator